MRAWWIIGCGLVAIAWPALVNAEASARLDRATVALGQTVNLEIRVTGQQTGVQPDLTPLRSAFEIVGRPRIQTSVSIINGEAESSALFVVTLAPLETGNFRIPSLSVGPFHTKSLELKVLPSGTETDGSSAPAVFVEVYAEPSSPYVQSQVTYRLKLFHLERLLGGNIAEPTSADALLLRLGDDVVGTETRHGRRYGTIERHYAVFPQSSGRLLLPAPSFTGDITYTPDPGATGNNSAGVGAFDRFHERTSRVYARGEAIALEVKPVPPDFAGDTWLPAQAVKLTETWSGKPLQFRAGEPATRTLTLTVAGLTGSQLPTLQSAEVDGVKMYADQPVRETTTDGNNVIATQQMKFAVVPSREGSFTLPAVEVHWWDTQADVARVARLAARDITVLPAATTLPATSLPSVVPTDTPTSVEPPTAASTPYWLALSTALGVLWLVSTGLWMRERQRRDTAAAEPVPSSSLRQYRSRLSEACRVDDPNSASQALLGWCAKKWRDDPPRNLIAAAGRFEGDAATAIIELDRQRYGTNNHTWDGKRCWQILRSALQDPVLAIKPRRAKPAVLPALYPD